MTYLDEPDVVGIEGVLAKANALLELDDFVEDGEAIRQEAAKRRPRDAGSYIGNQPWQGFRGDPISGTHNGKLDAGARARRAVKNARYRANRGGRAAGNQARGNRA